MTLQPTLFDQPRYHQTTSLTASQKSEYVKKAVSQADKILDWFKKNPDAMKGPSEIHKILFTERTPEKSVRARMTTLSKKGLLRKTDLQVEGEYGRPEHLWRLNK